MTCLLCVRIFKIGLGKMQYFLEFIDIFNMGGSKMPQ